MSNIKGTGDGTRPTTDGGVDNIGAGEKFTIERNAAGGEVSSPGPKERMQERNSDVEGTKQDETASFGLREDLTPETNKEQPV